MKYAALSSLAPLVALALSTGVHSIAVREPPQLSNSSIIQVHTASSTITGSASHTSVATITSSGTIFTGTVTLPAGGTGALSCVPVLVSSHKPLQTVTVSSSAFRGSDTTIYPTTTVSSFLGSASSGTFNGSDTTIYASSSTFSSSDTAIYPTTTVGTFLGSASSGTFNGSDTTIYASSSTFNGSDSTIYASSSTFNGSDTTIYPTTIVSTFLGSASSGTFNGSYTTAYSSTIAVSGSMTLLCGASSSTSSADSANGTLGVLTNKNSAAGTHAQGVAAVVLVGFMAVLV